MLKPKYHFNSESLSYDRKRATFKTLLINTFTYLGALFVIVILGNIILSNFYDTPKEKILKRENATLQFQFQLLNKQLDLFENTLKDLQKRDSNIYRTIFEAEPLPQTIRNAGYGGAYKYKDLEGFQNSEIIIQTTQKLDKMLKVAYVQSKSYDELIKLVKGKEKMLASIPAIQPISNKDLKHAASGWGFRIHPVYKILKFHYGMDFTAPTGTDIYATGAGIVVSTKSSNNGFGNYVLIDHGFGVQTLYAHMVGFNVKPGQSVKRGDIIGFVGNTGLSTAPHVHYEVHVNGTPVNPIHYYFNDLTPSEYDELIDISTHNGQTFD